MIEHQIIAKILEDKTVTILSRNGLSEDDFLVEKDKVEYILDHYRRWKVVPDLPTFIQKFPDYEHLNVQESGEYLVYKLKETKLYRELVPVLKKMAEKTREDAYDAIDFIKTEIRRLIQSTGVGGSGVDIVANASERKEEYDRRRELGGLLGISTGIKQLDELTHGWMPEDLVVFFARTNEGKSWILLYFLVKAWAEGNKVLLYSGEMSPHIVGFRFDTLYAHFSNMGLMMGADRLGQQNDPKNPETYGKYIEALRLKQGFHIITPKDLGGRRPTVSDIRSFAEHYDVDIIGVDQITLMVDERKGENTRIRYTHLAEDLFTLSEDLKIPVLAVTQSNREPAKRKGDEGSKTPELHEIGESDGIAQNSTRVFSMKVLDGVLRLSLKKNRYGVNNKDILLLWNVNWGVFEPIIEGETVNIDDYGF